MSYKRYVFQLRRGTSHAIESYKPILNEVIWVIDKKELWLWTGTRWSTKSGSDWYDLFKRGCLHSIRTENFGVRTCITVAGESIPVCMTDALYLQTLTLADGEPVCNVDTHTVHIGDGVTPGGIPLTS